MGWLCDNSSLWIIANIWFYWIRCRRGWHWWCSKCTPCVIPWVHLFLYECMAPDDCKPLLLLSHRVEQSVSGSSPRAAVLRPLPWTIHNFPFLHPGWCRTSMFLVPSIRIMPTDILGSVVTTIFRHSNRDSVHHWGGYSFTKMFEKIWGPMLMNSWI